ncbi:helix-turn-helix transcriptional regulator, partial [Streptomyces tailanensis]|uniref:helix-turn-helix transcriptional regulator n=1 Tax=Streptomyces tailanensis TaxID=2569858 RepID=UPI00122E02C7
MAGKRQRLAQRRKASGYTQEQFADALQVDRTTVQRWEKGEVDPQSHQRPKMAKRLELTSRELDELLASDSLPIAPAPAWFVAATPKTDDEMAAWELSRRMQASDVGAETLTRLGPVSGFDQGVARASSLIQIIEP